MSACAPGQACLPPLSGGEVQRIKLAIELQRSQRGRSLYVLDDPTTGLHAWDADRLLARPHRLVDAGDTAMAVEHETRVVARRPGADVAKVRESRTAG